MKKTDSRSLKSFIGEKVILEGWVHRIRDMGAFAFLLLRDPWDVIQVVVPQAETVRDIPLESAVRIQGEVISEPRAPQGFEVHSLSISLLSPAIEIPPFELNKKDLEVSLSLILDHRPLSLRHPKQRAIFRIEGEFVNSFRNFLRQEGFTEIFSPKIVATGTEGGASLFPIDYLGKKAYLAQSPQFYKQMMVGVFGRVFEVGHVYRAEPHATSRHINEYLSLDYEMGFIENEQDVMKVETRLLAYALSRIKENCAREIELLKAKIPDPPEEIPQLTLAQAKEVLRKEFGKDLNEEDDLDPEGEKFLSEFALKEFKSEFLFLTSYPVSLRPMYAMPDRENPSLTRSFDLLFRGMEVTTGGQRIHEYQMLVSNIRKFGLDPDVFGFYLEPFKFGMPPHGGLAIGAERITARLLGLENIRQACLFPRDVNRLTP
ncbi:MAG: aspartate--tRNA(Asn) ligase [Caldiserica bacterium]|jgi:nondiscriminating aspartyl-tRNA synthetase|nr:aspartate--tRNA(Asn) ligase [Caldisericota bacterium]MDH7562139.1 aspartate--tRNA(Asn) ligase [Caldisericota bacterium]